MKPNRFNLAIAIVLCAGLACNHPGFQAPSGDRADGPTPDAAQATLPPDSKETLVEATTDTSTPGLIRFVGIADGDTLVASIDKATGFPTAAVRIESDSDVSALSIGLDANGLMVAHVGYEASAALPYQRDVIWTPWAGNGEYELRVSLLDWDRAHAVLSSSTVRVQVTGIPPGTPTIHEKFIQLYQQLYGLNLSAPAFARYNKLFPEALDDARWISAAYVGDSVYEIAIFDDGQVANTTGLLNRDDGSFCRPSGTIRMLAVLVDYGNTNVTIPELEADLSFSLNRSNQRWEDYSRAIGLAEPILQVELTTAAAGAPVSAGQFLSADEIRSRTGYDPASFDVTVEVDIDAANQTVGQYGGRGVSLGGGCRPSGSGSVNIGMNAEAGGFQPGGGPGGSIFDHELTHGMGWMHWWPNQYADSASWIQTYYAWDPYLFFGWTDADGDGVIEILDASPYGLQ